MRALTTHNRIVAVIVIATMILVPVLAVFTVISGGVPSVAGQEPDLRTQQAGACAAGVNLIVNGDAEAGPIVTTGSGTDAPGGWQQTGGLRALAYGVSTWPTSQTPGPADRGLAFFAGGPSNAESSITQTIDVSDRATAIDADRARFALCGWLGGFGSQDDAATLRAEFRDGSGQPLGAASLGPVLAADRGDVTRFVERSSDGLLPTGTRSVFIQLETIRTSGNSNDGYAENLAFMLDVAEPDTEPEPQPQPDPAPAPPPNRNAFPLVLQTARIVVEERDTVPCPRDCHV